MRLVTTPRSLLWYPLAAALIYPLRTGDVPQQMLLVDEEQLVLPGPPDAYGNPTAWVTRQRSIVEPFVGLWTAMWEQGAVVPRLPLTDRQADMILAAADGHTDAVLARTFEVSQRTVSSELARACDVFGVSGRAALIAAASGLSSASG